MTEQQVIADCKWLYSKLAVRDGKYLRDLNRFLSNGRRREGIRTIYTNPPAYYNARTDDVTGVIPAINVGRSMTMTLQSKLIQTKGRVFFNPTNGLWETIKTCRNAQIFFDEFYEREAVYEKVQQCILDSLVFDMGVAWVDEEDLTIKHVHPWQFYVDPAEFNYNKVSRCMLMQEDYPINTFRDKLKPGMVAYDTYKVNSMAKVKVGRYWDLIEKKKYLLINSEVIETVNINYDVIPFAIYYYDKPIKGLHSTSLIDNVYTHQKQIDDITRRVHDAITLSPANTIYVPATATGNEGGMAKMMSNRIGNIIPFNPSGGSVVVSTPPPIDPSYISMLDYFVKSAFEQEGISMLSAQSKKPSGISSGVALDTLQDVESERFQAQVDQLIQFYKDINNILIEVFPEDKEVIPKRLNRAGIKWKDIKKQRDVYSMQSSLASALSKDPKVKMEQIEKLQQQGIINPNMAASLLQLPDLEGAYSSATASYDCSRKIIERALDDDRYDFYDVINLQQLLDEAVNILLQLDAADENPKILQRLDKLIGIIIQKQQTVANIQNPPQEPIAPEVEPIKAMSMDSGQITQLSDIVAKVAIGTMTVEVAGAIIAAGYPTLDPAVVKQMLGVPPEPVQQPPIQQ